MAKEYSAIDHSAIKPPQQSAWPARQAARQAIIVSLSLLGLILIGALLRKLAEAYESAPAADLSTALLFTPCSLAALTLGWRTWPSLPWKLFLGIALLLAVAFPCRMAIAVPDLWDSQKAASAQASYWWQVTMLHWCLFLLAAITTSRAIQWITGFGIWPISKAYPPAPLTLGRMLILLILFAVTAIVYQAWVRVWYPYLVVASEGPSGLWDNLPAIVKPNQGSFGAAGNPASQIAAYPSGPPTWYQWFPIDAMPWANGLIGGLLLPFHWLFLAWVLGFAKSTHRNIRRLIIPSLLAWVLVAAGLRFATTKLYFSHQIMWGADVAIASEWAGGEPNWVSGIMHTVRVWLYSWIDLTLGIPWGILRLQQAWDARAISHQVMQGAIQVGLTILSIYWLRAWGYRVGPYEEP
jgi:hypothetical protein